MALSKATLYVSRILPDQVMAVIRERFRLVQEPLEVPPALSALQSGLSQSAAAIVTLTDRIDAGVLAASPRLKIVANYAVGYNNIDIDAARQQGVVVTNTPDVLTDATADLTWALILATARRVIEGDRLVRSGQWTGWTPTQLLGTAVAGRTLGIIGMGRIGQAVARRAAGFRLELCYCSRRRADSPSDAVVWEFLSLQALLAGSDIVTLHVPLTQETRHLIGVQELAKMRRTAILINTARGPIVDESALVAALNNGAISGAGLDVFEEEPRVHPRLATMPHVVLLPHLGSATIEAVLSGQPAPNRVS